jgi:hypothetical protein
MLSVRRAARPLAFLLTCAPLVACAAPPAPPSVSLHDPSNPGAPESGPLADAGAPLAPRGAAP